MLAGIVLSQPHQSSVRLLREDERVELSVRVRAHKLQELLRGFVAGDRLEACGGETLRQQFGWFQMFKRCDWQMRRHTCGSRRAVALRVFLYAGRRTGGRRKNREKTRAVSGRAAIHGCMNFPTTMKPASAIAINPLEGCQ